MARAAARRSRASRASRVSSSATLSATAAKTRGLPSASVTRPARPETPVRVPVLARTTPAPGAAASSKRSSQRAGEAGDGQAADDGASSGCSGDAATRSTSTSVSSRSRGARDSPAVVHPLAVSRRPARPASRRHRTAALERALPATARPTWWASTSAASLSLTSRTCSTTWSSGAPVTAATSSAPSGPVARRARPGPGCPRGAGRRRRRRRRTATGPRPCRTPTRAPAVDPQRGDGRDDLVGEVRRLPVRARRRAGEERVVVADRDPAHPALAEALGREVGQAGDVGAGRVRRRLTGAVGRLAR